MKKRVFQFPSNGKAYPKLPEFANGLSPDIVSIPFKRESISKESRNPSRNPTRPRFNSLQTGKHIQSFHQGQIIALGNEGFNSLQTGKHIQSFLMPT